MDQSAGERQVDAVICLDKKDIEDIMGREVDGRGTRRERGGRVQI